MDDNTKKYIDQINCLSATLKKDKIINPKKVKQFDLLILNHKDAIRQYNLKLF